MNRSWVVVLLWVNAACGTAHAADDFRGPWALRVGIQSSHTATESQGVLLREPSHVGNALLGYHATAAPEIGFLCRLHSFVGLGASWAREDIEFGADELFPPSSVHIGNASVDLVMARALLDFGPFSTPEEGARQPGFGPSMGLIVLWAVPSDIELAADQPDTLGIVRATPRRSMKFGIDLGAEWRLAATGWSLAGELVLWIRSHAGLLELETGPQSVYSPATLEYVPSMLRLWVSYRP